MNFSQVLTEGQIDHFRRTAETLLETVGFQVQHAGLLQQCRAAGAQVDEASGLVRLPAALQRELLAQVPRTYTIRGVHGETQEVGGDSRHCRALVTDPWIIDYTTKRPRRPCLDDLRRHTIIAQQLPLVKEVSRMDFPVTDVEGPSSSLRALEVHLKHNAKHQLVLPASVESMRQWLDLGQILMRGQALAGSRIYSMGVAVLSPLVMTDLNIELLYGACEHDFAVVPTICDMAGTTSPFSMAATLVQANAEALMVAALTQIVRPGNPFLYTSGLSVTDMQTGHDRYYSLDKVLWKIASAQLGRSYGFPVAMECGGTMTYQYDQQNGAEGMLFMLGAYSTKSNVLCGIGSCYNALGMSAEMMVIQSAWLAAAEYLNRGIRDDEQRMALENIRRVGPGGHFVDDDLTMELLRSDEFFANGIFDLSGDTPGERTMLERAHDEVNTLLNNADSPLPSDTVEHLSRYFAEVCPPVGCGV